MGSPTLSVVIPTYNRRDLVLEAIDSVLPGQPDIELIVVDDGSTDGTAEAVEAVHGSVVRLIQQPNRGRSAARNAGVSVATGDYVTFLDSDDVWESWHVDQFRAVAAGRGEDVVYAAPIVLWDPLTGRLSPVPRQTVFRLQDLSEECLVGTVLPLEGLFVPRRHLVEIGGFDPDLGGSEDWEFLVRLVRRSRVEPLAKPSVRARVHAGRSMADIDWDLSWRRRASDRILGNAALALTPQEQRLVAAGTSRYCAARLYEAGRMAEARAELARVRALLPGLSGVRATGRLELQSRIPGVAALAGKVRNAFRSRR